ncbi:MAG: FecR domain-containing protein [Anaerolineae bacterium]
MVLWIAFAIFVCLAVSVPLSVRWYLLNATRPQNAYLEKIDGMLTVHERRAQEPIAVNSGREIKEGFRVATGPDSRATITFFENSTALLYGDSRVLLERLRRPRFSLSPRPDEVKVVLEGGLVRFRVAEGGERARLVEVQTPHGQVRLEAGGSYSVEVVDKRTRVVVRYGRALVLGQKTGVALEQGQRVDVEAGGEPGEPMPAAQNLVVNGDFRQPLEEGWKVTPYADLEGVAPGEASIVNQGDRNAVYFVRMGSEEGVHTEISIEQEINRDVRDNVSLVLRLDVRLEYQSLPGAGYRSSEFPVMVELRYRDAYGRDLSWYHGFYYRDPPPNWPMRNGEKIPPFIWYPYESGNLMEVLGDARPVHIHSLRIYASGWNYRSMVSEVGLIAE